MAKSMKKKRFPNLGLSREMEKASQVLWLACTGKDFCERGSASALNIYPKAKLDPLASEVPLWDAIPSISLLKCGDLFIFRDCLANSWLALESGAFIFVFLSSVHLFIRL